MKELKEYLDVANWPAAPYGLTVDELVELTDLCQKMTKEKYGIENSERDAIYEAVAAAFALGFERGHRKAENAQKRAKYQHQKKTAAEARKG